MGDSSPPLMDIPSGVFRGALGDAPSFCLNAKILQTKTTRFEPKTRDYFDATASNWNTSTQSRPLASLCIKTGSQIGGWVSSIAWIT